jgi:hypothetical protein
LGLFVPLEEGPVDPNHFTFFMERCDLCRRASAMKETTECDREADFCRQLNKELTPFEIPVVATLRHT